MYVRTFYFTMMIKESFKAFDILTHDYYIGSLND